MKNASKIVGTGLFIGLIVGLYYFGPADANISGPGVSDSYTVICQTTATTIRSDLGTQYSYQCQNESRYPVYIGDSGVTTATGSKFCNHTSCPGWEFGGPVREEFCITDLVPGTVTIRCRSVLGR